ncbi:MAG: hypothetical protein Q8Q23_06515 [bacterium]|nr:hypothetical protein [bacterium]
MNKAQKVIKKLSKKDKTILDEAIANLVSGNTGRLNIQKIVGTSVYRMRVRKVRVIFHYQNGEVVIDQVRDRSENTYKNL